MRGRAGQAASSLSDGHQRKVVIAQGLARGPRVVILDEPGRDVEVGPAVLLSKAASFVSGIDVLVDGGFRCGWRHGRKLIAGTREMNGTSAGLAEASSVTPGEPQVCRGVRLDRRRRRSRIWPRRALSGKPLQLE